MPAFFPDAQTDHKNNFVALTLFESFLAKFILEHPEYYEAAFLKLFDKISQNASASGNERAQFAVFSQLQSEYPMYASFECFKNTFDLPAADYLLKLTADYLFPPVTDTRAASVDETESSRRSPTNTSRNALLFDENSRGVTEIDMDEGSTTNTLGIIASPYQPEGLKNYFKDAIDPAGQYYAPNETSYVAYWLRQYQVPLISGASGSTQALIARLLPQAEHLTQAEKQLIVFAQACNMIAHGHHSFFEAMIVADDLELISISPEKTLAAFYLQCIPEHIQNDPEFIRFMHSNYMQQLLLKIPVIERSESPKNQDALSYF